MKNILCLLEPSRSWSRRTLEGVSRFARAHADWHLDIMSPSGLRPEALYNGHRPDAIIGAICADDPVTLALLRGAAVPMVNVSDKNPPPDLPNVLCDDHAIGRVGGEYLLGLGYRHYAFLGVTRNVYSHWRRQGFEDTIRARPVRLVQGQDFDFDDPNKERRMTDWLKTCLRPLAVMTASDTLAWAFETACLRAGLRIPDDVAILGVNNDQMMGHLTRVPLASVDPHFELIGARAAEIVRDRLSGKRLVDRGTVLIPPKGVVARRSASQVMAQSPVVRHAMDLVRANACKRISFDEIVEQTGVSRRSLERYIRQELHCTPHDLRRRARLDKACELLLNTDDRINRIAHVTGFCEAKVFAREFRLTFGLTPRRWRQSMRVDCVGRLMPAKE